MKIISWNVNGLRSLLKTDNLDKLIEKENPDILCMSETKLSCPYDKIREELKNKYNYKYLYFNLCSVKKGYSGTLIMSKKEIKKIDYGLKIGKENLDDEGRMITMNLGKFYLITVYTPNSGDKLQRLDWRVNKWDRYFEKYIKNLQKNKPVIICGDLNVIHEKIDIKNWTSNLRSAGNTEEERDSFKNILKKNNLIDSFRELHPTKIKYSYWSYMGRARERNTGWRLDYFLLSKILKKKLLKSVILTKIMGSDHAPIKLKIKN